MELVEAVAPLFEGRWADLPADRIAARITDGLDAFMASGGMAESIARTHSALQGLLEAGRRFGKSDAARALIPPLTARPFADDVSVPRTKPAHKRSAREEAMERQRASREARLAAAEAYGKASAGLRDEARVFRSRRDMQRVPVRAAGRFGSF